jgi:MFS family permease
MGSLRAPAWFWPLVATLAMQTLATMAAYSLPAAAPAVAADLGVEGSLIGFFISAVYGVSIVSAVLSPGFIHRFGGVRVGQLVLVAVLAMLATAASGSLAAIVLGAVLLGLGYGATAPVSAHVLVPLTPPARLNLVLSIRQIGVPLGGVLGSLIVPPLVLSIGWRPALLLELVPVVLLLLLLELPRRDWDGAGKPGQRLFRRGLMQALRVLVEDRGIRRLSVAAFIFSGIQLTFIAFMTVHLTRATTVDLVTAGQVLAVYQVFGVVSRPIWGWLADNWLPALKLLVAHGIVMGLAAMAAGQFGPAWPLWALFAVAAIAGATASGYTGLAYGELARQGGERRTEATAAGSAVMFAGVMALPSSFGVAVTLLGGFEIAYAVLGLLAWLGAAVLIGAGREGRA